MTFNNTIGPTILTKLKEATRDHHQALEQTVDVMSNVLTRDAYERLLTDFYRFYSSIEPHIDADQLAPFGIDAEARRKTPLLERDLKNLGVFDKVKDSTLTFTELPALDSVRKMFGSMYVMEGATLGGQVITRHLREHLNVTPENGGAFFNSYGQEVGPMWKQFCAVLNKFADEHGGDDEIIEAAGATFDSFALCLSHTGAERSGNGR